MHAQTRRQREVLDFITRYIDSHGYRPSYQLIARHMGVSSRAGIARIVHDLESQGLLTRRRENGHFYIDVGKGSGQSNAAGGVHIEWLDVPNDSGRLDPSPLVISEFMLGGFDPAVIRAFRVPDNHMDSSNICEDDIALIELRQFARDGQRVVALIDEERTVLRKYYREGADIELRADSGEVLRLAADRVEIKGIYRGLLRPM
jgi:repressor LexA